MGKRPPIEPAPGEPVSFAAGQANNGRVICGAKNRSGRPCGNDPAPGRTRCRLHGGKTPVGPAANAWKDGRHSKYVRGDLLAAYERALADPNILSMEGELALVDARIAELLTALGDGGSPSALWVELGRHADDLERAIGRGDKTAQRSAVGAILALRAEGRRAAQTWSELDRLIERRRRVAETEQKRIVAAQASITVAELTTIVMVLLADARDTLGDNALFTRLAGVWRARLGPHAGPTTEE